MDITKYIENKKVKRLVVATDIVSLKLSLDDIDSLCDYIDRNLCLENDSEFIGSSYENKKEKDEWSEEYLKILKNESVSEVFNRDYLKYLYKVSKYVNGRTNRKIAYFIPVIIGIIILCFVIIIVHPSRVKDSKTFIMTKYLDGNELEKTYIACDIAYGKLSRNEIETLIKELNDYKNKGNAKKSFCNKNDDKATEKDWNEDYLIDLIKRADDKWFNAEYLRHLYEVKEYLIEKTE